MLSGLNIILRSVDADAAAFCRRSGAEDKRAISAFVRGVKGLGLWENMVCWPLRSTQNAGTGTTAYSLGGLGTYNGTLTNGPTWGSDGVDTSGATNRYIISPNSFDQSIAHSLYWAGNCTDTAATRGCFDTNRGNPDRVTVYRNSATQTLQIFAGGTTIANAGTSPVSGMFAFGVSLNGASSHSFLDGEITARSLGTLSSATAQLIWGNANSASVSCGKNAFFLYLNAPIGTGLGTVHELYKSTLGQGLSLP